VLALLLAVPGFARAQNAAKPEKVRFTSIDGVELHGSFYPSKRSAPTVLILHAIGEDSKKKGWLSLAEQLQKDYCVLTFDFRGHGDSTEVQSDLFWKQNYNRQYVRSSDKATISHKGFDKRYYPVLVNDIAAAKAFLDRSKNDSGVCNTSSFVIIGAETGASLGAIWLNAEWHRYKMIPPMMFGLQPQPDTRPEGKDVVAAIWLSMSPMLGTYRLSPSAQLEIPGRQGATPMVFMYSDGDEKGKGVATKCASYLKATKDAKYGYIVAQKIEGGGKLTGVSLLQKALGTGDAIADYLEKVMQVKGNEWTEREFKKSQYVWRFPGSPKLLPAKFPNEQNLMFETYEKFIRSQ
jgi:hypothetical protein